MSTEAPDRPPPERYAALALQLATHCINDCRDRTAARERMAQNLARVGTSVADTPIGRLAAIASEEIQYPEIARMGAMRGAEILIHPSSEVGSPSVSPKELGRRARAAENIAYVVSANSAALTGTPLPAESTTGMSKVVDYYGQILAEAAPGGESMVAYADSYRDTVFHPANLLLEGGKARVPERREFTEWQRADIARLTKLGVL